jgi:hypothetical protein
VSLYFNLFVVSRCVYASVYDYFCLCVYVYVCVYACMWVHVCLCVYVYVWAYLYICVFMHQSIPMCLCVFVSPCEFVCVYVCLCLYVGQCVFTCVNSFVSVSWIFLSTHMCIYVGQSGYLNVLMISYHYTFVCKSYVCLLCVCAYLSMSIKLFNLCLQFLVCLYFLLYFINIHFLITHL